MAPAPSLAELTRVFGRIGFLSFGGPAAQIALMQEELVEARPWLTQPQFLNALSFCMLLPGPEAMQLATYAGWRLRGTAGGLIAGALFVLPGACVILALAFAYALLGTVPLVQAVFLGVQAAVVVIVLKALLGLARRTLTAPDRWALAGLSFAAIFVLGLPFPLIIALAAGYGALRIRVTPLEPPDPAARPPRPAWGRIALWLTAWLAPIALLWAMGASFLTQIALFFAKLAVVTFGGAYAVLAYMTQEVVAERGWLDPAQMIDALGLAETTPGPLILVTQFVGFLAGFLQGGPGLALAAALVTLWVTFVPCFLWIFTFAPYVDWIATRPRLTGALQGITAAVVGVILNLALWFALHVLFAELYQVPLPGLALILPELGSVDGRAVALTLVAAYLSLRLRLSLPWVLGYCAVLAGGLALI
ncbi:chromate efflux transporter [Dinoroseobacter sp. S375]|uniref:chromate efflux transporter n=1 Tax=Dinoroseobacter sp. S375 TaxID=3415136 RepID=UPI003C7ECF26